MITLFTIPTTFTLLLSLFSAGAIGSLCLFNHDELANRWSGIFSIAGSALGIILGIAVMATGHTGSFVFGASSFPLLSLSFHLDQLSAFFIFTISIIALFCSIYGLGYVRHYYGKYSIGALGFFYNLFILAMLLVVSSANGLLFIIVWEIMSVTSYFLVAYDRQDKRNVKAGLLYLIMTHVGTAFIVLSFLLLYKYTSSFDFATIKAGMALIPSFVKNAIFILALIGFGTKAGIIPLHIWLPSAHPAAPSHVSALMSGVMIKTGIYMMIRMFLGLLSPVPLWWGLTVLVLGSVSALLGVLYALTEHDIKRLLAYHSIENIGIILLGLGSALTFSALNLPSLALLGLVAALFHTLNHATFKSLLFLSAGSVIHQTRTRNMEDYGGLIKTMPQTAFFFLIGAMAISALPPLNGFFSEWLTFQTLFHGMASLNYWTKWIFVLSAGSLAFTGGLALACFVKAFGAVFLARPRSDSASRAKESGLSLRIGMGALAMVILYLGLFSGMVVSFLERIAGDLGVFRDAPSLIASTDHSQLGIGLNFASVSAPVLAIGFILAVGAVWLAIKYGVYRKQNVRVGVTWDCGTNLTPRMEITATGFSRSIITIFKGILRPSLQHDIEYHDAESRYLPKSRTVTLGVRDVYQTYFYRPLQRLANDAFQRTTNIQSGNLNAYILYILIALIIGLYWVL